jgi:hypothetical protein
VFSLSPERTFTFGHVISVKHESAKDILYFSSDVADRNIIDGFKKVAFSFNKEADFEQNTQFVHYDLSQDFLHQYLFLS